MHTPPYCFESIIIQSLKNIRQSFLYYTRLLYLIYQGRQIAAEIYKQKVLSAAHRLHGLYYRWRSKRLRLILHLQFVTRGVVKIQSCFRRRVATKFVALVRLALHIKKSTIIQSAVRQFLYRKRVGIRWERLRYIRWRMAAYTKYILRKKGFNFRIKQEVVESVPVGPGAVERHYAQGLDVLLCSLAACGKYDTAYEVGLKMGRNVQHLPYQSRMRDPHYRHQLLLSCMDASDGGCVDSGAGLSMAGVYLGLAAIWTRFGKIRQTRVDLFEEALGMMMQHSFLAHHRLSADNDWHQDQGQEQEQKQEQELTQLTDKALVGAQVHGNYEVKPSPANDSLAALPTPPNEHDHAFPDTAGLTPPHGKTENQLVSLLRDADAQLEQEQLEDVGSGELPELPPLEEAPAWLQCANEEVVELYFQNALQQPGAVSLYDALLLMADWVSE